MIVISYATGGLGLLALIGFFVLIVGTAGALGEEFFAPNPSTKAINRGCNTAALGLVVLALAVWGLVA